MRFQLWAPLAVLLASSLAACQWYGITPKENAPPTPEVPTVPLALNETTRQELDCPSGNCQMRFRMLVDRPGELSVSLQPRESGDSIGINIILEDPIGRVVDRYNMQDVKPPLIVKGPVQPGPHTVLVQAIGGRLTYDIRAKLRAGGRLEEVAGSARPPSLQPGAPTRLKYGADSAADPKVDFSAMRRYAFAQNPEERLQTAEPGQSVGNPFFDQEVQHGLRMEFDARGFRQSPADEADFLVDQSAAGSTTTWYSIRGTVRNEAYDYYFDLWAGRGGIITPHSYRDGTLVIDLIDPVSGDLIWHGWSTEPVNRFDSDKDTIQRFVKQVLDLFPPTE